MSQSADNPIIRQLESLRASKPTETWTRSVIPRPGFYPAHRFASLRIESEPLSKRQRGITGDTALRLARYFGTSAQLWINLQAKYGLAVAEDTVEVSTSSGDGGRAEGGLDKVDVGATVEGVGGVGMAELKVRIAASVQAPAGLQLRSEAFGSDGLGNSTPTKLSCQAAAG